MYSDLTSALPYEKVVHEALHEALKQRFWPLYKEFIKKSCRLSQKPVTIQIDEIQDQRIKMERFSEIFVGAYEGARIFSTQVLEELAMRENELLLPIAQMTDDFMVQPIGLFSSFCRQDYVLVTFLEDYQQVYQQAHYDLLKVFMRNEPVFSLDKLAFFSNVFLHQGYADYANFMHQDLHFELIPSYRVLEYFEQVCSRIPNKPRTFTLETLFDSIIKSIDKKKMTDWLNGEYFYDEEGKVKRHYLESYVYADDRFVVRLDDFAKAFLYLRLPKDFICKHSIMTAMVSEDNGFTVLGRFEQDLMNEIAYRYELKLQKLNLPYPQTDFEKRRYKQLLEEFDGLSDFDR